MHHYTGLATYVKLFMVLYTLGPAASEPNYYHGIKAGLSVEDQFFLCLIKLREHTTNFNPSRWFGVAEATVKNIFVTLVYFDHGSSMG